ncbi:MAG: PKD domain-containing protein [Planctomycetes bacterium]|nr:PKD domain-containing protein [Planctomycetota bacterium]
MNTQTPRILTIMPVICATALAIMISLCQSAPVAWGQTPAVAPANSAGTSQPAQPVVASIKASRDSGVAPLAVFFDGTETKNLAGDDYVGAHFEWDFGDSDSGIWATTGKSKNLATGFVVSHVYEKPGAYTVTLKVRDIRGNASSPQKITITVEDPEKVFAGTNTRCVSKDGKFDGSPAGCEKNNGADLAGHLTWFNAAPKRRLLLRRGEKWECGPAVLTGEGPKLLGAFGEGENPVINFADSGTRFKEGLQGSGRDWRVVDVGLVAPETWKHDSSTGPNLNMCGRDNLALRVNSQRGNVGVRMGGDNVFLQDSRVENSDYISIYTDGVNISISGCIPHQIRNATSCVPERALLSKNVYVAHNIVDGSRKGLNFSLKWHSRNGVVTDNRLTVGTWRVDIATASGTSANLNHPLMPKTDDNLGRVLFERNVLIPNENPAKQKANGTGFGIDDHNDHIMVRNNLLYDMCIGFEGGTKCRDVHIYNNTVYMSDRTVGMTLGNADFLRISRGDEIADWNIRNNIMYSLHSGTNGTGALCVISEASKAALSNNLYFKPNSIRGDKLFVVRGAFYNLAEWQKLGLDANSKIGDALFESVDPSNEKFLVIKPGSPAIDAGVPVPVFEDFNRRPRTAGKAPDIGAFEFGALAPLPVNKQTVITEVKPDSRPTPKPLSQPANPDQPKPVQNGPAANGNGSAGGAIQTTAPPADSDDPESQAKRRLSAAKIYIATDPARAKDLLRKVITDYPDTETAKEARKELNKLN